MNLDDTIIAISSAVGSSARIILRTSGPHTDRILESLGCPATPVPCERNKIHLKNISFPASIWKFSAPHSYTGQDMAEFHIPGNPLLARLLMERAIELGARPADPGEFTARAYFNNKLDLTQAEGVAASISARSAAELAAARQLLSGQLARRLRPIMDNLADTAALVEVGIDFSEEDVQFLSHSQIENRLAKINQAIDDLLRESSRFENLSHEPTIVLCGPPNAGKSTLANALAGQLRSIVSPVAGTTRDILAAEVFLPRGKIRLLDIAGIETPASGEIARQMQHQAQSAIAQADLIVSVKEISDDSPTTLPRHPDLCVRTKADLHPKLLAPTNELLISALTGHNLDRLRTELDRLAFGSNSPQSKLALTARHLAAIEEARRSLTDASKHTESPELLAADLRASLDSLGDILGLITPDDVLGRIFSTFCIGK